jgi:hypothetical protein
MPMGVAVQIQTRMQSRVNIPVASGCASFGIAVSRPNLLA